MQKEYNFTGVYVVAAFVIIIVIWFVMSSVNNGYVHIKYRDSAVDISGNNFEPIEAAPDSTVKGAWYDGDNAYMVIKLSNTYYQYCGMPSSEWAAFRSAQGLYSYYSSSIKGNYDCRINHVPTY